MNSSTFASLPDSACTQTSGNPDRITEYTNNHLGQITEVTTGVGTANPYVEQTNTYANMKLTSQKDGENNLTTYSYDGFDRLSEIQYPVPAQGADQSSTTDYETFTHDPNGNVVSHQLRDGTSIGFTFDNLNRITLKDLPGTEPDVSYDYNNMGWLKSATQTGSALSFTYDALGRNLTQVGPQGTVTSVWDLAGRRTRLTYPGSGLYVKYDYLLTGEVQAVRQNGATTGVGVLATYAYDNLGNRISVTFGNGETSTYGYDPASRLTSLTNDLTGTANDLTINGIAYNPASQVTSVTRSNDAYAWTGHGNGSTGYSPNGLNQYTSVAGTSATYDARGNMTTDPTTGKTYGYSSENLLTSASGGVTLAYDAAQRLYEIDGASTTRFAYDGTDIIAEYDASNVLQRRFVFGPGINEPIVEYEGSGTTSRRWLHADDEGSIVAITDSSGTTINRYDEYGKPQSTNSGRFQYGGEPWIAELGLYYLNARMYAPHLGRFMQTDPTGTAGGINLYAYADNDPVNSSDPFGLQSQSCTSAACLQSPIVVYGQRNSSASRYQNQGLLAYGSLYSASMRAGFLSDTPFGHARIPQFNFIPRRVPCSPTKEQLENSGAVTFAGVTASGYLLTGATFAHGSFWTESGIEGNFTSIAFGFGAGVSFSGTGGAYYSLAQYVGGNDNYGLSLPLLGQFTASYDLNGNRAGGSYGYGIGPSIYSALRALTNPFLAFLGASASVSFSNTDISNVTCLAQ